MLGVKGWFSWTHGLAAALHGEKYKNQTKDLPAKLFLCVSPTHAGVCEWVSGWRRCMGVNLPETMVPWVAATVASWWALGSAAFAGPKWRHHSIIKVMQNAADYPRFTQPSFSPLLHNALTVNHLHKDALNTGCETCYHTDRRLVIETSFIFLLIFFIYLFSLSRSPPSLALSLSDALAAEGEIGSSEWPADEAAGALMNRTLIAGSPRCKLQRPPPLTTGNYRPAAAADALCIFITARWAYWSTTFSENISAAMYICLKKKKKKKKRLQRNNQPVLVT